ncbi:methyltransferase [Bacteroidia bacterium]|nr:methyltransferase [Bacteroidia bacterium]
MRIINGFLGGRNITPPHNFSARPTTDFAKEALFNILIGHFDLTHIAVLDLFSGTGCISYEFASRGCPHVDSVESNWKNRAFIQQTIRNLRLQQIRSYQRDAFVYLRSCTEQYNIIFADPPYNLDAAELIPNIVFEQKLLAPDGWLILEHDKHRNFEQHPHILQHRNYGNVHFSMFAEILS